MNNRTRAQMLLGTGALLASISAPARAQALTTIRYGAAPLVDNVPVFYAQATGLFRSAGLDVQIQKLSNTSAIAAAMAGGSLDVGEVSAMVLVNAHNHGVDLKVLYPNVIAISGRPYYSTIIVAVDSPIHGGKDLNGMTMSSAAIRDTAWLAAHVWIDANGGDSSTVKFVELPFSSVSAAVQEHRVDAGVTAEPYFSQAISAGVARSLGDLVAGLGPRSIQTTYAATADYIAKNREALGKFVRVVKDTHAYLNSHRSELATYTEMFTMVPIAKQRPDTVTFATDAGPRDFQPWITAAAKYGIISRSFDAADLFVALP